MKRETGVPKISIDEALRRADAQSGRADAWRQKAEVAEAQVRGADACVKRQTEGLLWWKQRAERAEAEVESLRAAIAATSAFTLEEARTLLEDGPDHNASASAYRKLSLIANAKEGIRPT